MSVQKPMPPRPPEPPPPPPSPAKQGGVIGKFVKLVLFVAIVAGAVTMYVHGKRLGEARAIAQKSPNETPEVARQKAKFLPPWNWTTDEWDSYKAWVFKMSSEAKTAVSEKTLAARDALKAKIAEMRQKSPAEPQTTSTPPATTTGTGAAPMGPSPTAPQPASMAQNPDAQRAHRLVMEASELWEKHDFPAAKAKLDEAQAILAKLPSGDPAVEEDRRLAHDLLEDIAAR